jgi:pimeloyl-ACP methyl ester carboxylesterase
VALFSLRQRQAAHLARWLGPWAGADSLPPAVARSTEIYAPLDGDGAPVRCHRYEPGDGVISGAWVVAQGLHYAGPDDPRMDRFCRVLASAGWLVLAPFLSDYLELRVATGAAADLGAACETAVRACAERGLPRPAVFSISFGSTPAIEIGASDRFRDRIGALVLFGGFSDFHATIRFAVSGRAFDGLRSVEVPHDPLNTPAVFVNLVEHLDVPGSRARLAHAWREMARRTWGRPELRPAPKRIPIAEAIAAELDLVDRPLFMIGCGLDVGGPALLEAGLARAGDRFGFTAPGPRLARVAAPVVIAHGKDDDVVPWSEALKLRDALPGGHARRLYLTGLWAHTGSVLPRPRAVIEEAKSLRDLAFALVDAPHEAL